MRQGSQQQEVNNSRPDSKPAERIQEQVAGEDAPVLARVGHLLERGQRAGVELPFTRDRSDKGFSGTFAQTGTLDERTAELGIYSTSLN